MKLSLAANTLALMPLLNSVSPTAADHHEGEEGCTHGMLFVSSTEDATIRAFDLSNGLEDLAPKASITVPSVGPELNLSKDSSGKVVSVVYRGSEANLYQDGAVRWIDSGVSASIESDGHMHIEYTNPSMIDNAAFDCARAIHYVTHDSKIGIFCDGAITDTALVNSTVWVIDEALFGDPTQSAVVYSETLQSSHHGVAIPVDDNHLLYSLATPDRLAGNSSRSYSLPHTFQVVDYEGNVLHSITDTTDKDNSCSGFHGSWGKDNTFALACDDDHGGILVVNYDQSTATYESRSVTYPSNFPDHRTGSFAEHHKAPLAVGNFAATQQAHLVRFDPALDTGDISITSDNVLTLGTESQCSYQFEQSEGQLLMVLMPDGTLKVYEVEPDWKLLVEEKIVPDMENCADVHFVPGYGQVFILTGWNNKVYSIDLAHIMIQEGEEGGELEVTESNLDFRPYSAIVAGVTEESMCRLSEIDHEDGGSGAPHHDARAIAGTLLLGLVMTFAMIAV